MDISRQVATAKNDNGDIIASVTDYYDRFVHKMGKEYQKSSFKSSRLVLCPFHADVNPSMGLIKDKNDKKVEIFHCFGCGASGNVVSMHKRLAYVSESRNITIEVATKEVATIYGIELDYGSTDEFVSSLLAKRESDVESQLGEYNFASHKANLMKIRMNQEGMSIEDLAENIDRVLIRWKSVVKVEDEDEKSIKLT